LEEKRERVHEAEDLFVWKIASSSELKKRRRQEANSRGKRNLQARATQAVKILGLPWMGEQGTYMYYKYPLQMFASAEGGGNKIGALGTGTSQGKEGPGALVTYSVAVSGVLGDSGKLGFPCDIAHRHLILDSATVSYLTLVSVL